MASKLQKVRATDKVRDFFRADTWNAFVDATLWVQAQQASMSRGIPFSPSSGGFISVFNNCGEDKEQFSVVGLDSPLISPDNNEREFRNNLAMTVSTPSPAKKSVVLQETIKSGKIGRAMVIGITPVKISGAGDLSALASALAWYGGASWGVAILGGAGGGSSLLLETTEREIDSVIYNPGGWSVLPTGSAGYWQEGISYAEGDRCCIIEGSNLVWYSCAEAHTSSVENMPSGMGNEFWIYPTIGYPAPFVCQITQYWYGAVPAAEDVSAWSAATEYQQGDIIKYAALSNSWFEAAQDHESGSDFAEDAEAGLWRLIPGSEQNSDINVQALSIDPALPKFFIPCYDLNRFQILCEARSAPWGGGALHWQPSGGYSIINNPSLYGSGWSAKMLNLCYIFREQHDINDLTGGNFNSVRVKLILN